MKPSEINAKWKVLQEKISIEFDSEFPDLKVMLFLIGVQELGKGPRNIASDRKKN